MEKLQVITITIQEIRWETLCIQIILRHTTINCRGSGKIANPFTVFFMGHKGIIEAKYTTNKGVLPEALINEMREAFKRSEEFLDLEVSQE